MIDKSVYPGWAKAWGEGMTYDGGWMVGKHISFYDDTQGGTKALLEKFITNEAIEMKHIAMVNPQLIEISATDDMIRKWIGSEEKYYFKKVTDIETKIEVVMVADEAFEEMMNAWTKALELLKEICES